jgi:dipeptidyl aminopeptidase/acylaminoacyl peptidase
MEITRSFEAFLNVRAAYGGVFSPDGRCLAYLMNTSGIPQVYRQDAPSQAPVQLTDTPGITRSVHWSPDGKRLAFLEDQDGSEREQVFVISPDGTGRKRLIHAPQAIHKFGGWSPDCRQVAIGSNERNPEYFDLYVVDVETGERRRVVESSGHLTPVDWSADGQLLLIQEELDGANQDLHVFDLGSGELRCVTPHTGNARYECARFIGDGRSVVVCTDQDGDFLSLARLDTKLCRLRVLLERRADVETCDLTADGKRLVALLNRDGWSELIIARLDERILRGLVSARLPGVASSCRISPTGNRIALSLNGPTTNFNVWSLDPETTARTQWTRATMGELEGERLIEPTAVRYPSHDGLDIPALLYCPPEGTGRGLPVVVHVHGGPEGQDRPNFSPVYQYLVSRGYGVLAPNVRGSTGYGNHYSHLDDREKRVDALRDVEYAARWLKTTGIGDPDRLAIVGISNFETFFKHTGPWRRKLRASEYGDPERDAALLRKLSPIHRIDRIRAPLMIIQGANDPRVPQEESDQMVEQLRARSHPVEYLLFPDEGHGIVKLPNRIRAYTAIGAFLDQHLMPSATTP